jgi:predicted secreted protein
MLHVEINNFNGIYMNHMKEIHIISHCFLNPAVRLKGLKPLPPLDLPGHIIQLPCPEAIYSGLNRWESTREQLDIPNYRRFCREIFQPTADTLQMLYRAGHKFRLIGVKGSPSCGIMTTSVGFEGGRLREMDHSHIQGTGIFFNEIIQELKSRDIEFNIYEQ